MKSISLKVTDGLDQQLETAAEAQQTTKSDVVREALEMYFADNKRGYLGSCLALAGDLVGCAEGPEDLSFDKRHLSGFGA